MNRRLKYTYWLGVFIVTLMLSCSRTPDAGTIDERMTMAGSEMRPFGAYTFRWLAQRSFVNNEIINNTRTFDKWHNSFISDKEERTGNVYFLITPGVEAYKDEVLAMTDFVERGNTLFVAANYFDDYFLEMFSLEVNNNFTKMFGNTERLIWNAKKRLTDSVSFNPSVFSFFYYPMARSLATDSSKKFEALGQNDFRSTDMMRMAYGKGQIIIMTNVQALSNYFLLTRNNYLYALAALSYLPEYPNHIYWDDFYRRYSGNNSRPPEGQSMFSALLAVPQLRWAFWLLISMTIVWFCTNLFRRQRIIPVQKQNSNSSIEFTQTIARLYFNKKDNHNIALKMIAYFQDHVRTKYYMNYTGMNEEFAYTLAAKTGLSKEKMQALVNSIHTVQHNGTTDDMTLLTLNSHIQEVLNSTGK